MSLQFFNTEKPLKSGGKEYMKPLEVLNDPYLTPIQKHMVLEAMLTEARDQAEENGHMHSRQILKVEDEIIKAQMKVKKQMA